jgi:hypothetical protein
MALLIDKRLELHALLLTLMPVGGKVYFQPIENIQMSYPAIVYARDFAETIHADNFPWKHTKRYQVTVIDKDPDSDIPDKVSALPMCQFQRHFTSTGLNHDIYNLYY